MKEATDYNKMRHTRDKQLETGKCYIHFRVEDFCLCHGCSRQKMIAQHIKNITANVAKFTFNLHQ